MEAVNKSQVAVHRAEVKCTSIINSFSFLDGRGVNGILALF